MCHVYCFITTCNFIKYFILFTILLCVSEEFLSQNNSRRNVCRQNVRNTLSSKCLSAKFLSVKCPSTGSGSCGVGYCGGVCDGGVLEQLSTESFPNRYFVQGTAHHQEILRKDSSQTWQSAHRKVLQQKCTLTVHFVEKAIR